MTLCRPPHMSDNDPQVRYPRSVVDGIRRVFPHIIIETRVYNSEEVYDHP